MSEYMNNEVYVMAIYGGADTRFVRGFAGWMLRRFLGNPLPALLPNYIHLPHTGFLSFYYDEKEEWREEQGISLDQVSEMTAAMDLLLLRRNFSPVMDEGNSGVSLVLQRLAPDNKGTKDDDAFREKGVALAEFILGRYMGNMVQLFDPRTVIFPAKGQKQFAWDGGLSLFKELSKEETDIVVLAFQYLIAWGNIGASIGINDCDDFQIYPVFTKSWKEKAEESSLNYKDADKDESLCLAFQAAMDSFWNLSKIGGNNIPWSVRRSSELAYDIVKSYHLRHCLDCREARGLHKSSLEIEKFNPERKER